MIESGDTSPRYENEIALLKEAIGQRVSADYTEAELDELAERVLPVFKMLISPDPAPGLGEFWDALSESPACVDQETSNS